MICDQSRTNANKNAFQSKAYHPRRSQKTFKIGGHFCDLKLI